MRTTPPLTLVSSVVRMGVSAKSESGSAIFDFCTAIFQNGTDTLFAHQYTPNRRSFAHPRGGKGCVPTKSVAAKGVSPQNPWGVLISSWGTWFFVMGRFVLPMGHFPIGNGANPICQCGSKIPFMWLRIPPVQGKSNASSKHHKRGFREHMSHYGKGCVPTKSVLTAKTRTPPADHRPKSSRRLWKVNASASQSQRVSF